MTTVLKDVHWLKLIFEVNFYKNFVVSFFGKMMENLRNRVNINFDRNSEIKKNIAV